MATGDIHISVVPATSATGTPYTYTNPYGTEITTTERSIASTPSVLAQYINEQQNASPAKTLIQILDGGNRLTLVLKED